MADYMHPRSSPLFTLATCMAYLIKADGITTTEEKAKLITSLRKHVSWGDITAEELQTIVSDAFGIAGRVGLDVFLHDAAPTLSTGQRLAIFVNLYDAMLVDGHMAAGETTVLGKFAGAFGISHDTLHAIRTLFMLMNDTAIFTDRTHPYNEPTFNLEMRILASKPPEGSPQLTQRIAGSKDRWKERDRPNQKKPV